MEEHMYNSKGGSYSQTCNKKEERQSTKMDKLHSRGEKIEKHGYMEEQKTKIRQSGKETKSSLII